MSVYTILRVIILSSIFSEVTNAISDDYHSRVVCIRRLLRAYHLVRAGSTEKVNLLSNGIQFMSMNYFKRIRESNNEASDICDM